MYSDEFEGMFSDFLDSEDYDQVEMDALEPVLDKVRDLVPSGLRDAAADSVEALMTNALVSASRMSFAAGMAAAGGDPYIKQ